jgi:hypothetical protein
MEINIITLPQTLLYDKIIAFNMIIKQNYNRLIPADSEKHECLSLFCGSTLTADDLNEQFATNNIISQKYLSCCIEINKLDKIIRVQKRERDVKWCNSRYPKYTNYFLVN